MSEKFKESLTSPKDTIDYSKPFLKNLEVSEKVESETDVFPEAETITAKIVETNSSAFYKAKNCQIEEVKAKNAFAEATKCKVNEVNTREDAFSHAFKCEARNVNAGRNAFYSAFECKAEKVQAGENAFVAAIICDVQEVEAKENAFFDALNCRIGKVKAGKDAFGGILGGGSIDCEVEEVKAGRNAFEYARNCLIKKRIEAGGWIGLGSLGIVVLGEIEGKISPSLQVIKNLETPQEKVVSFFEKEFQKQKNKQESIFQYFHFLDWEEVKNLEEGVERIKKQWNQVQERAIIEKIMTVVKGTDVSPSSLFLLAHLFSNQKKIELFSNIDKLKKNEIRQLRYLSENECYQELAKIDKKIFDLFSLKDLVKLGEYVEFLKINEKALEEINRDFPEVTDSFIKEKFFKEPEKFTNTLETTSKLVKNLTAKGKEIKLEEIKKHLQKEIEKKRRTKIREFILNIPFENLKTYAKAKFDLQLTEEDEDLIFALRLQKRIAHSKNLPFLEDLILGKSPLNYKENQEWLKEMERKINVKAWLEGLKKEYSVSKDKIYYEKLKKHLEIEIREIFKYLKKYGIVEKYAIEEFQSIEILEKMFKNHQQEIDKKDSNAIRERLNQIKSLWGIASSSLPEKVILETENNPLKILQMGEKVTGSCLGVRGVYEDSVVANAIDINKKILWIKDPEGKILGRVLMAISDEGKLVGFRLYNNDPRLKLAPLIKDYLSSFAKMLNTEIGKKGNIRTLVAKSWYNDGIYEEW